MCVAQSGINSVGSKLLWRGGGICAYAFREMESVSVGDAANTKKRQGKWVALFLLL